jgi:hypothetical protein
MTHVAYWLFDETCSLPQIEGYVGVTRRLTERIREHRKHRPQNGFNVAVIFEGTEEDCYTLERELRPRAGIGWNLAPGGPDGFKREIAEETRAKLRRPKSEEHKRASGAGNRGKIRSEETLRALSESHKGKMLTLEHRAKIGAGLKANGIKPSREAIENSRKARALLPPSMLGKTHSQETRAKMSVGIRQAFAEGRGNRVGFRGRHHSEETKEKIRTKHAQQPETHLGKKHTDETKARISKTKLARNLQRRHLIITGELK